MFNNIKGVIFDLDGTLIDSMWVWDQIDMEYLNEKNLDVPENLADEIGHLSFNQVAVYFKERFKLEDSLDEIKKRWSDMAYYHYSTDIKLKEGVVEFLQYLKKSNIKIGLATSNSHALLEVVLKNNNIYNYFNAITITDEVSVGKHEPDVYLLAAKKLGVSPNECLVFEDIAQAIKGAKKAGMKVVGVADSRSLNYRDEIISLTDKFITNFNEIIPEKILN